MAYSKAIRLQARENWAVLGLSDEENIMRLGLKTPQGSARDSCLIRKWRCKSKNTDENWQVYRDKIIAERTERNKKEREQQEDRLYQQMLAEYTDFRHRRLNRLKMLEELIFAQIIPRPSDADPDGPSELKPDVYVLKALKMATESYQIINRQFDDLFNEYFASNPRDNSNGKSWLDILNERYATTDITELDPAMSKDFYLVDDESFKLKYLDSD